MATTCGAIGPEVGRWIERATSRFIHIPGPNPILRPGAGTDWDGNVIETCDVLKDEHTYYLYYHARPGKESGLSNGWRIGAATAPAPLGPWTKYEGNPIVDVGPEGRWTSANVACASVLKEGNDQFSMWYYLTDARGKDGRAIGLAKATSPLGPWEKHKGNPVMEEDFGYVGGVVKVDGTYRMVVEHPISSYSSDQGPMALATAERPEGPWTRWEGNPVLVPGDGGAWDDGGYSEARMVHHEGIYHLFYGGTKATKLESIGYAYSFDGIHFIKHPRNPIGMREHCPDTSAFAEVCVLFEPPFVYAFHTQRYISRGGEDLGVQVFAMERPFRFAMPLLAIETLEAGRTTPLDLCPPISLERVQGLSLTAECTYDLDARKGLRLHLRSSCDGVEYDTIDCFQFENHFEPGARCRQTLSVDCAGRFVKVAVENLDAVRQMKDVKVTATLTG